MFTYTERDANLVRYPAALKITVPLKPPTLLDPPSALPNKTPDPIPVCLLSPAQWSPYGLEMQDPPTPDPSKMPFLPPQANNEIHPDLIRLPSLTLRGTFLKAYSLLVQIVRKVGWDELLRGRSMVFVMEEEYRAVRARGDGGKGKEKEKKEKGKEVVREKEPEPETKVEEEEKAEAEKGAAEHGETPAEETPEEMPEAPAASAASAVVDGHADGPAEEAGHEGEDGEEEEENGDQAEDALPFTNKRLCERWLDNLFMVLYEVGQQRRFASQLAKT
jgi:hypothetical protein